MYEGFERAGTPCRQNMNHSTSLFLTPNLSDAAEDRIIRTMYHILCTWLTLHFNYLILNTMYCTGRVTSYASLLL